MRGRWHGEPATAVDRRMAATVMAYWVNFARHGNPNGPALPTWPRYTRGKDQLLELGSTIRVKRPERAAAMSFLDGGVAAVRTRSAP